MKTGIILLNGYILSWRFGFMTITAVTERYIYVLECLIYLKAMFLIIFRMVGNLRF
ncbi:MAG: hypothetical protein K9M99_10380 [Candidatus Cloacimonetes bacterium]|nr:hypothetical protein [Candidatus Cloacimonadota bacterium]